MDLLESFISSLPPSDGEASSLRDYFDWQSQNRAGDFNPSADDDVDLRTYLLDLLTNGAELAALEEQVATLKLFYHWAQTKGIITHSPFDEFNFAQPLMVSDPMKPRQQGMPKSLNVRELKRLRALSQIAEQLNSSVDIQTALENI